VKSQHINGSPETLKRLLEEYTMIGYNAEIIGDELIVHMTPPVKPRREHAKDGERWSKRERNFGFTRG
jgi:hypothetical protein